MPADEIDQYPGDQATAHAANGVATDIQAHGQANVLWMDLFAQIRHRHGRQAAQRQPQQRTAEQHAVPAGHQRADEGAQGCAEQGKHHHRLAPDAIRDGPGDQQADRQHAGRHREDQAALRSADGKLLGQQRHHRLHAVEQGKGGKAAAEQRQYGAQKGRGAFFDPAFVQACDDLVERGGGQFVDVWSNSSFHG
ncbi:hypothetical protein D3C81_736650 [compost metagenome]